MLYARLSAIGILHFTKERDITGQMPQMRQPAFRVNAFRIVQIREEMPERGITVSLNFDVLPVVGVFVLFHSVLSYHRDCADNLSQHKRQP